MRFFRTTVEVYEQVRLALNEKWGFPNAGTDTCFPAAADYRAPKDAVGRVLLAAEDAWCEWDDVQPILADLLESGEVEEVGQQDYFDAASRTVVPEEWQEAG